MTATDIDHGEIAVILLRRLAKQQNLLRYNQFKTAYAVAAKKLGYEPDIGQRQVERWLDGQLKGGLPRPASCAVLEEMFGLPAEELFAADTGTPEPDAATQPSPAEAEPGQRDPSEDFRTSMWAAAAQSRQHAGHADAFVGSYTMEQLHDDVVHLARGYMNRPPVELFADIVATREQVFHQLDRTRRPDQIVDLHLLAGVLSGLLSQVCIDFGEWRLADDHALAAWSYANTIGHAGLAGWARGMQATIAFWDGRPSDALLSIRRGERYLTSGPLAIRLHSLAARAWSHCGDVEQTMQAVRAAEETRAGLTDARDDLHDGFGGLFRWTTTRQEMCASSAYRELAFLLQHDADDALLRRLAGLAVEHARRALAASRAETNGSRSVTLETSMTVDLAAARAIIGDQQGTCESLSGIFDLPAENRTVPLLYRLTHLRTTLAGLPTGWARELNHDLSDLAAAEIPAISRRALLRG